jgi:hypothetical protein
LVLTPVKGSQPRPNLFGLAAARQASYRPLPVPRDGDESTDSFSPRAAPPRVSQRQSFAASSFYASFSASLLSISGSRQPSPTNAMLTSPAGCGSPTRPVPLSSQPVPHNASASCLDKLGDEGRQSLARQATTVLNRQNSLIRQNTGVLHRRNTSLLPGEDTSSLIGQDVSVPSYARSTASSRRMSTSRPS